ncbi:cytochrome c oxidase subunit 3 [Ferroacidibacillus organovorans]|uniref:Heme-copper oxidase subunit III family profile domain-containing protein n=1 Tax=Ferroacidibacillus organovorans TaxID=1765683 RepID=A0A101XSP4_9BACL|nr:cytochrome c oxidase subunit 3 [Ferroacidibacillus organovorans]KUO96827.1 hypothetical protein ATW55_08435 [Ferroacidibacillus organovorans]
MAVGKDANETRSLDWKDLRAYRFSFWLVVASNTVYFFTLIMTKLLMAQGAVPSQVNQWLAMVLTILMVGSVFHARSSLSLFRKGEIQTARKQLRYGAIVGTLILIGGFVEWASSRLAPGSSYGQSYYALSGLMYLELFVGAAALWSTSLRSRFEKFRADNHWGLEMPVLFWQYLTLAWIVVYVVLYIV